MNIELINSYGFVLKVTDTNIVINEDIEERDYPKDENGKIIFNKGCKRDIKAEYIYMIAAVLQDMLDYREKPIDTSNLIETAFDKLPEDIQQSLLKILNKRYELESI